MRRDEQLIVDLNQGGRTGTYSMGPWLMWAQVVRDKITARFNRDLPEDQENDAGWTLYAGTVTQVHVSNRDPYTIAHVVLNIAEDVRGDDVDLVFLGVAKRNPGDQRDINIGAMLAIKRALHPATQIPLGSKR